MKDTSISFKWLRALLQSINFHLYLSLCSLFLLKPSLDNPIESLSIQLSIMRETSYIFVPIQVAPLLSPDPPEIRAYISGRLARDVQRRIQ